MDANLKQVLFDKMSFNNMNGKLTVKDGKVDMKNLSMSTMGGNVVMNGYYSTADAKKPELKAGFKLTNILHKLTRNWIWCRKWLLSLKI